jgi:translation elongation factor EF-4
MGLGFGMSSCRCSTPQPQIIERIVEKIVEKFPNPNPKNFKILQITQVGKNVLLVVQYPDCTNYEGKKVMVYRNVKASEIKKMNFLDPHFCDNHISPFARFEPTEEGIDEAYNFAKRLKEK